MNNANVCHEWAAQAKTTGKGHSIFYDGSIIYSYGRHFPMARLVSGDVVLFTSKDYSVTTAKHKSYARRAISSRFTVFTVPNVLADSSMDHKANAAYLMERVITAKRSAFAATKHVASYENTAREGIEEFKGYMTAFGKQIAAKERAALRAFARKPLWTPSELARLAEKLTRAEELTKRDNERRDARYATRRAAWEARDKENAEKLAADLEAWAAGTGEYRSGFYKLPCRLRVVRVPGTLDANVETSHGASVPFGAAVRLLGAWQAMTIEPGQMIGPYTVETFTAEEIKIGCHKITRAEAERVIVPAASIR